MSKKLTLLTTSLLAAVTLLAQKDTLHEYSLDPVIVTANKTEQKQSSTGKMVTVITRQQMERSEGKDFAQLLNEQTGFSISGANSNPGKDKTIYLRGASSNYTIILLDGIPLNDPSGLGGAYDIRMLVPSLIERIEILKGSQSTLYGSNAVAGVINIITRKASSDKTEANALLSYGTYNTFKGNGDVSNKGKVLEYNLNYQYLSSDGIAEARDTAGTENFPKNGLVQQFFMANLGINVTERFKMSPFYRYATFKGTYSNGAFSGGSNPYNATLNTTGLVAKYQYDDHGSISANYGYDFTDRNYSFESYTGKFHHAEVFVNHRFDKIIQLTGGINFQSFSIGIPDSNNTLFSSYASVILSPLKGWHIDLGGRYNHHNRYGNNFTYSFNPSYLISQALKVFINLSTGFRAPSLSEMLSSAYVIGNPGLKPEKSTNIEAGIELWLINKTLSLSGAYFDRKLTDAIENITVDPVTFKGMYLNRDKQHDQGVEAELSYQPSNFSFKASYMYVYGRGTQKQPSGKDSISYNLLRRPKNTVNLSVGYQFTKHLFITSSLQTFGQRGDNSFQNTYPYAIIPITLKAYALWNMYVEYQLFNNKLLLFADAKNLTNNINYYEAYGYNVQGFTINSGIRFKL